MASKLLPDECKILHTLIDKGEITNLDLPYSNLLNLIHEFIDKFIKMTYDIGHAMGKNNVSKIYKTIESYNCLESYDILRRLKPDTSKTTHRPNQSLADGNSNFKIIFEDHENKACCNEKCAIF